MQRSVDANILDQRRRDLDQWRRQMDESVVELGRLLGIDPPTTLSREPLWALPILRRLMAQDMGGRSDGDRAWVATTLLAIIGQQLMRDHDAQWVVEHDPASLAYARYILRTPAGRKVDLGALVDEFLAAPTGREVLALVAAAESRLSADP